MRELEGDTPDNVHSVGGAVRGVRTCCVTCRAHRANFVMEIAPLVAGSPSQLRGRGGDSTVETKTSIRRKADGTTKLDRVRTVGTISRETCLDLLRHYARGNTFFVYQVE